MITDLLKTSLADHIESALIVQGYHWNIEGPDFEQYHSFFGDVYSTYSSEVDRIAEYIRIVSEAKEYVNASVNVIASNMTVKSKILTGNKPIEMTKEIIILNDVLLKGIKDIFVEANKQSLDGLADYCAGRIDCLSKLKWKLIAITK